MPRRFKVLLCGYYGMGNLGDELLLASCLDLLNKNGISREETAVLSGSTELTEKCYNVTSVDRWNLKEVYRACRNSDSFLLGGGGIFQDSTSLKSVVYYWLVVRIARACGCRVWAVGQSVGPLKSLLSRALTKDAFACCDYAGVRDGHSLAFLGDRAALTDDLVLSLPFSYDESGRDTCLVNFRRTTSGIEWKAVEAFSRTKLPGVKTIGVAMSSDDASFMEELCATGRLRLDRIIQPDAGKVTSVFSRGAAAFGMRLHFGVLSLKCGVPCTMVPYDPKVSDFASRWGCPQWRNGEAVCFEDWKKCADLDGAVSEIENAFSAAVLALKLSGSRQDVIK